MLIDTIAGYATAPGSAGVAATILSSMSRTIKAFPSNSKGYLLNAWLDVFGTVPTDGAHLILQSQRLHDNRLGIDLLVRQNDPSPLWPLSVRQEVFPQDQLDITIKGTATVAQDDTFALMLLYDDMQGQRAVLADAAAVNAGIQHIYTVPWNPAATVAAKALTGESAINATNDNMIANRKYALLGYSVNVQVGTIFFRGPDTGFGVVPMPGLTDLNTTRDWFLRLSMLQGKPLVPIIDSGNKAATYVSMLTDHVPTDTYVTLIMALLVEGFRPTIGAN